MIVAAGPMPMQNQKHKRKTNSASSLLWVAGILLIADLAAQESTTITHFRDSNTDRVPLMTAFPTYPSIARRDRIEGEATVCFKIRSDGRISRVRLKSATHRIFRKPAIRAIKQSTFEPLAPNQVLATAKTCRTYRFRLEPILVENNEI